MTCFRLRPLFASLAVSVALAACSGGSDLDDPDHVRDWANSGSALAAFLPAHAPLAIAEGRMVPADPSCPTVSDDGTVASIVGGCEDSEGTDWIGEATVTRDGEGGFVVVLAGFGRADEDPVGTDGTITIVALGPSEYRYDADTRQDGLTSVDVTYSGTLRGGWDAATVWSGSGTVTRGGFADASGTSAVTTVDQVRDPSCGNQSWSGTTTIEHDGRTLVVEYDGVTDCDDDATARYTVDGEDRGAIDGIRCAASPGSRGAAGGWLVVVALAALVGRRRISRGRGARRARRGRGSRPR